MHTFSQVGTFEYFCEVHPSMQATITVTEGPASAPEPTAAPQPTATPSPTATPEPTATATPAPTATPVPTATASAPAIVDSVIQSFQLQSLNVAAGTTVIWRNADGAPHTATNGNSPIVASSFEFKSPVLQQDGTYMHTFDTPGVFLYFCEIHPSMKGVITVQ
jgi:plastocyanin